MYFAGQAAEKHALRVAAREKIAMERENLREQYRQEYLNSPAGSRVVVRGVRLDFLLFDKGGVLCNIQNIGLDKDWRGGKAYDNYGSTYSFCYWVDGRAIYAETKYGTEYVIPVNMLEPYYPVN